MCERERETDKKKGRGREGVSLLGGLQICG